MLRRVLLVLVVATAWSTPAGATAVTELVREAHEHAAAHEEDLAIRRFSEALALDPTCSEAYLGLGDLRARMGDAREAERVYSVALAHVPDLKTALVGRARARHALGAQGDAEADLETYAMTVDDPNALRELAAWYGEDRRTPSQLAAWRRMLALATRGGDAAGVQEARTMVRALEILVGPADPVAGGRNGDAVRRAMAAIAKRGG